MDKFRELDLLLVIVTLFSLVTVIRYFASSDKTPTNNNIEYVDSLDSSKLKYPLIIKDGEVYQLTEKINWEVME